MPSASVSSTTSVNPGDFRKPRAANRMSRQKPCISDVLSESRVSNEGLRFRV